MSEEKEQYLELDEDQLQELMSGTETSDKLPPIMMNMEDYDELEFQRGIKDASYTAGVITGLLNAGVTEAFVLDFILNKETINHNLKTAEINKEMNIAVAKNQRVNAEKYEL